MKYVYPIAIVVALLIAGGAAYLSQLTPTAYVPAESGATTTPEQASEPALVDSYTLAEVAAHASKESCWTTVDGDVYDLTSFIPNHPGGEKILKICGIDGSSVFGGKHGANDQAKAMLATLKIGVLAQ